MKHPKFLKNQISLEIKLTMQSIPLMSILTVPWFLAEIYGYSLLYMDVEDHGWNYLFFQFPLFLAFTDMSIYFIHRALHWPMFYKRFHKPHHRWIVPTPFASHAFHPVDGYVQSLPYHFFPFIFPLHKFSYLALFTFINIWTILIHDGEYFATGEFINSAAHHTVHHLYFNYNYGQFTTLWDRMCKSHCAPDPEFFNSQLKLSKDTWRGQCVRMEKTQSEVEGVDDRNYESGHT